MVYSGKIIAYMFKVDNCELMMEIEAGDIQQIAIEHNMLECSIEPLNQSGESESSYTIIDQMLENGDPMIANFTAVGKNITKFTILAPIVEEEEIADEFDLEQEFLNLEHDDERSINDID